MLKNERIELENLFKKFGWILNPKDVSSETKRLRLTDACEIHIEPNLKLYHEKFYSFNEIKKKWELLEERILRDFL